MNKKALCGSALLTAYFMCVGLLTEPSLYQLLIRRLPEPRLELVPFADIFKILTDEIFVGAGVVANLAGNVLMFFPLGVLLPLFWRYFRKAKRTVLCGFLMSLSIELIQLTAGGVTSTDDVLLNTLGTALGFVIASLFLRDRGGSNGGSRKEWAYPMVCWLLVIAVYTISDFAFL